MFGNAHAFSSFRVSNRSRREEEEEEEALIPLSKNILQFMCILNEFVSVTAYKDRN